MKNLLLAASLALPLLSGCRHSVGVQDDPALHKAEYETQISPPLIYEIEWWKPLVVAPMLEFGPLETAQPAIDPDTDRVVVGTRDGHIHSLSPDGKQEWELVTPNRFYAGATISNGIIYMPGGDGTLYAIKARTGEKVWEYKSGEELVTRPVIEGKVVLVASQADTLFAVDVETGKWLWQYRRDMPSGFSVRGASTPTVKNGMIYQGFADGTLVALSMKDGATIWEKKLTTSGGNQFLDVDTSPVVDEGGRVYAASYKDGIECLDGKTGDLVWVTAAMGITSLIPHGDVLYASGDGKLTSFRTNDGRSLWTLDLSDKKKIANSGQAPIFARGYLIVPTSTGLFFIDPAAGRVRTAMNPGKGITATPTPAGKKLYVLSNLGTVFALRLHGGAG